MTTLEGLLVAIRGTSNAAIRKFIWSFSFLSTRSVGVNSVSIVGRFWRSL